MICAYCHENEKDHNGRGHARHHPFTPVLQPSDLGLLRGLSATADGWVQVETPSKPTGPDTGESDRMFIPFKVAVVVIVFVFIIGVIGGAVFVP